MYVNEASNAVRLAINAVVKRAVFAGKIHYNLVEHQVLPDT
jgi:hypothetical protein